MKRDAETKVADELQKIFSIEPAQIHNLVSQLTDENYLTIKYQKLLQVAGKYIENKDYASSLIKFSLAAAYQTEDGDVEGIKRIVSHFFSGHNVDEERKRLLGIEVSKFIACQAVRLVSKTRELSINLPNIVTSTTVSVDMRPVFDQKREKLVGNIIHATLTVNQFTGPERSTDLNFTLDENDLLALAESLEKAVLKIRTLRAFHQEKLDGECVVLGEEAEYGVF